jgi:hypothetical protein
MTTTLDLLKIADAYIALWNERDAARRAQRLGADWTPDARYADPMMQGAGAAEIDALIGGVQQRFPDFAFALSGTPDGHGPYLRFSWSLGPQGADGPIKGTDFVVTENGRIRSVTGFLDQVPG